MDRRFRRVAFTTFVSLMLCGTVTRSASAVSYTYINLAVPGAIYTSAADINSLGQIVGHYGDEQYAGHAFSYIDGTFTTHDVPGAASTFPSGNNDAGVTVGNYAPSSNFPNTQPYVFDGTSFLPFDLLPIGITSIGIGDLNNVGQVVGNGQTPNPEPFALPLIRGFVHSGAAFTMIDLPGFESTGVQGINDAGQVTGIGLADGTTQGFIYSDGLFTLFDLPWAGSSINFMRINNAGDIAGNYHDGPDLAHGFVYSGGVFSIVDVPGAAWTQLWGMNDNGQVVGSASYGGNPFGFLATPVPEPSSLSLAGLAAALAFASAKRST